MVNKFSKLILFAILLVFAVSFISAWDFYGYAKYSNGTAMNATNVTVTRYNMSNMWAQVGTSNSSLSNSSQDGFFNVSGIINQTSPIMYGITVRRFNGSGCVDWIGKSAPEFPYQEMNSINNISFYLRRGATINITANNGTAGENQAFYYMLKDTKLGWPIAMNFDSNMVNSTLLHVEQGRNYSLMIYPNNSLPVSYGISNSTIYNVNGAGYTNKTFNCTDTTARLTGNMSLPGNHNITDNSTMKVITFIKEPGRMFFFDHGLYNISGNDIYNNETGWYNISILTPAESDQSIFAFYLANTTDGQYGGFKEVSTSYDNDASANLTLRKLVGSAYNFTVDTANWGEINITANMMILRVKNSTGGVISDMVHLEVEIDYYDGQTYNMTNFTYMVDAKQDASGVARIPMLNISTTPKPKVNMFAMGGPPATKRINQTHLNNGELNITMKEMFDGRDPDDAEGFASNLKIDMLRSNSTCDVVSPSDSCRLFGSSEMDKSGFEGPGATNPLKYVLSGAPISLRIRRITPSGNDIIIHYVNIDMLASGPPDVMMDDTSDTSGATTSAFEEARKLGSGFSGSDLYDYIIIGIPYTEGSTSSQTGFNEDGDINMSIDKFYDEEGTEIWDDSEGVSVINSTANTADFTDYINTSYEKYLNDTNVVCNASDTDFSSGLCYKDKSNNMLWFKLPHFSNTKTTPTGDIVTYTAPADDTTSPGGSSGVPEVKETYSWTKITPGVATIMKDFDPEIGIKQIQIEVHTEAQDVKVIVTKYDSKPAAVSVEKTGKVSKYLQIETENLDDKLEKAVITIQVNKSWISDNALEKDDMALFKFDETAVQWNELTTTYTEDDDTYYYYDIELTSFSYFAIGEKVVVEPEEGELIEKIKSNWIIIVVVVVLIILVILYFLKKKKIV